MVRLMMRAAHQKPDKAETANMSNFLRITCGTVRARHSAASSPWRSSRCGRLRSQRSRSSAGSRRVCARCRSAYLQAASICFAAASALSVTSFMSIRCSTQRFEIDLRPIGLRVDFEDLHDLLDRSEASWPGIIGEVEGQHAYRSVGRSLGERDAGRDTESRHRRRQSTWKAWQNLISARCFRDGAHRRRCLALSAKSLS